jgi:hypothetical protein
MDTTTLGLVNRIPAPPEVHSRATRSRRPAFIGSMRRA